MNFMQEVYKATAAFSREEQYRLVSQIRRAAISVCSNIAEGASRVSKREKKRSYEISTSSLVEIDIQFEIAILLKYYTKGEMQQMEQYLGSTFRMLSKMITNLSNPTSN